MTDQEKLIRQAIAAEAAEAVDSRVVLAELQKKRRSSTGTIFGVVGLTVAAAATAVILPTTLDSSSTATPAEHQRPETVLVTRTDDSGLVKDVVLVRAGLDGALAAVNLPRFDLARRVDPRKRDSEILEPHMDRPEDLLQRVHEVTGILPDHYAAITTASLGDLAEVVGGVDVCIKPIPGGVPDGYEMAFGPGEHTISGADVGRYLDHQQQWSLMDSTPVVSGGRSFITGLFAKLDHDNVGPFLEKAAESVHPDPTWDVVGFAERFRNGVELRTATLPHPQAMGPETRPNGNWDPEKVKARITAFFDGGPAPFPPGSPGAPADQCSY
ncbi:LCP family protein [Lentzea alba]|uniref:LCP family glycopolymer transferase n=1 Tax=Lentzea alba TaxID=2714351 RepID=UPI0039BFA4CD